MTLIAKDVTCPQCGNAVGRIATVDGLDLLAVNGILVRSLHGVCQQCGAEFHWSSGDRLMAELVRHVQRLRADN